MFSASQGAKGMQTTRDGGIFLLLSRYNQARGKSAFEAGTFITCQQEILKELMARDYKAFSVFWFRQYCKKEFWWLDSLGTLMVEKETGKLYELIEHNTKENTIIYEYAGHWTEMESEDPC